jgi:Tfp pilus assembly protein FimT
VGAALGLALPFLGGGLEPIRSAAAARGLTAFLNQARTLAVARSRTVEVAADFAEGAFTIAFADAEDKSGAKRFALPEVLRLTGFKAGGEMRGEGKVHVRFFPLGDSSGGTFFLEDAGGRKYRISVGLIFASPALSRGE